MSRRNLAIALAVVLTALMIRSIQADDGGFVQTATPPNLIPPPLMDLPSGTSLNPGAYQPISNPTSFVSNQSGSVVPPAPIDADLAQGNRGNLTTPPQPLGYVRMTAPMYPTPRPNIPAWSGQTVITNQAFAPQEMLYPHTYRAIYPPFYHRVKGGWIVTPLGVRSHENWELQGTTVEVNYRSNYPGLLSGAFWTPHVAQTYHSRWR